MNDNIKVDVYYSHCDITALRWLAEIKKELNNCKIKIDSNYHKLNSDHAKIKNIYNESILVNNKKVHYLHLRDLIENL